MKSRNDNQSVTFLDGIGWSGGKAATPTYPIQNKITIKPCHLERSEESVFFYRTTMKKDELKSFSKLIAESKHQTSTLAISCAK